MHQEIGKATWKAPAKVNLSLKIQGKRQDGFHELESLMAPLDLCDLLHFQKADSYQLECGAEGVPVDETNLITQAVRVFEKRTGAQCHYKITLEKKVPHGAGLGGGSSDAATTLLALNELEDTKLTLDELASMGAEFGSDVPFFIYQKTCRVRGRGEIIEPLEIEGLSGTFLLLLKPSFGVSTPDAYKNCLNAEPVFGVDYSAQKMLWGEMMNDLEKPVFYKHRFLAEMKTWLLAQPGVKSAMMSGSGSTMMAFIADKNSAQVIEQDALEKLDPHLWTKWVQIL
ncbi:MAG: 4-(cytidine 5'-diphospho)-2-C-methyl-D-erythritol kinase [Akkermansiaceae bacterium]